MSAGHFFSDINQGALPAMLPFLVAAGGLKYAQAAGLAFALSLSASIIQPIFGLLADKSTKTWLLPLGVLLSGCGLSMIGFFPNQYTLMFASAVICGVGVAAYHPEGARLANRLSGEKKTGNMSIFTVGGTLGIAAGPLIVTPALIYFGLRGSAVLAVPAIIMCIGLFFAISRSSGLAGAKEKGAEGTGTELRNEWLKFLWLGIAIICRSIIANSTNTFIPLYWLNVLNQSKVASGMVLSFMIFTGAVASVIGGYMADRFGINKIIKLGWFLLIPSLFFLTRITNPVLALLMLVPIASGNYLVNTPLIVLGQKYLPKNVGFASGITLGMAASIGGLVTPFLGRYADLHGLPATLKLLSILPILGMVVAFTSRPPAEK